MNIGEIRQELYILESELAAEQGRWKGYVKEYEEIKKAVRFRYIVAAVFLILLRLAWQLWKEIMQLVAMNADQSEMSIVYFVPDIMIIIVTFVLGGFGFGFLIAAIWKHYILWRNGESECAKNWCRKRKKENLSELMSESSIRLAGYYERQEKLCALREKSIQENTV